MTQPDGSGAEDLHPAAGGDWFAEAPVGGYEQRYRVRNRLFRGHTGVQDLEVLDLESFGRGLVLDGALQTTVGEEFTYHEMIVHVPMFAHPSPRRVLIIGGGDGGTLRHVLLHPGVERAVEIEIDGGVIEAARRHLPEISRGAYEDPRVKVRVEDGIRFVQGTDERFDVILVDSTDPIGPAAVLIGDDFLRAARRALAPGGLMCMQAGSPLTQPAEWVSTHAAFARTYPIVKPYLGFVLIYPGIVWSWVCGSDEVDPTTIDDLTVQGRMARLPERLRVYNPSVHRAAFALPTFLRELATFERPPNQRELQSIGHPFPRVVPA